LFQVVKNKPRSIISSSYDVVFVNIRTFMAQRTAQLPWQMADKY